MAWDGLDIPLPSDLLWPTCSSFQVLGSARPLMVEQGLVSVTLHQGGLTPLPASASSTLKDLASQANH